MSDIVALYDEFAPKLYALALRITGDEQIAGDVLEEIFTSPPVPTDLGGLVRAVREKSLGRENRSSVRSVVSDGEAPTPRRLVEAAFFEGQSLGDLSKTFSIDEKTVRVMLRQGLDELKKS